MLTTEDIGTLCNAEHTDPFRVLGPHLEDGGFVIRAQLPGAISVQAVDPHSQQTLAVFDEIAPGLFEARADRGFAYRLRIDWGSSVQVAEDPYRFGTLIDERDLWFFSEGTLLRPWQVFGAHPVTVDGVEGVRFALWAPNVRRVSVVGDFNGWNSRRHMMRSRGASGVWEIFIPGMRCGDSYKYEILTSDGRILPQKSDPFAFRTKLRPETVSVVSELPARPAPIVLPKGKGKRAGINALNCPVSIYEVHAGSWMRHQDGSFYSWADLEERLIAYVRKMGFTHIELLPVSEHPFDGSWGYQTMGLYAPSARYGAPEDFAHFVEACHKAGIGVIVDWVPAHFPKDAAGLSRFTGDATYEHGDPREGEHKDWGTYIYNLGRNEVIEYLVGNALFWAEVYGVDGLRVDAVASMLYRDYSRKNGEWIANKYGGRENLESIAFLRRVNEVLSTQVPDVATYAEESTAWPSVSKPASVGGLGFHYKWNMGWMHDVLNYMKEDPINRSWHHGKLTFGMMYAYAENFVLPLSHDEVVHGKCSLIEKMPGDDWKKFANLRALYGFMWTYPGKKLLFMGGEFAQRREWSEARELDWNLLEQPQHLGMQRLVADLNKALVSHPALYESDCNPKGFEWLSVDDKDNSVVAFVRRGASPDEMVLVVCNFTPIARKTYRLGVPEKGTYKEILNTDSTYYAGSNTGVSAVAAVDAEPIVSHGRKQSILLTLPPLSAVLLEWRKNDKPAAIKPVTVK